MLTDSVEVPPEILNFIEETFENGLESTDYDTLKPIVRDMYFLPEKKKLSYFCQKKKMQPNLMLWHKILIHLAYNIGP